MPATKSRMPSLDALRTIVAEKQAARFRFTVHGKTKSMLVDLFTASAIIAVHDRQHARPDLQAKIARMIESPHGFPKIASIAMGFMPI